MLSARWIRLARKGLSDLALIACLAACSCRAASDGSTAPATSGVSAPSKDRPAVSSQATAQQLAVAAATSEQAPKPATPPAAPAEPPEPKPAATPASVSEPSPDEGESLLLENLANALRDTPFSAVVQHLRVDVVPLGSDEVKFVYQVRVLENIRGPKLKKLTYYSIAEKGEDPNSATEPVILTLCKDKEGYYWPGTGAQFPRTKNTSAVVDKLRPELNAEQKLFEQCEDP
jgi:hypothetical protein